MQTSKNTKRSTLKDIASRVGVSPRAVSSALNGTGRVSQATQEKIRQVAKELNYRPNAAARSLVQNRTYLLGALFPYANVSFFNDIISGIEEKCNEFEYDMLLGNANLLDEKDERPALMRMINRGVDGILCAPDYREIELFRSLESQGTPTVQVMTRIEQSSLPYIGVDNTRGGYLATKHLLELGHEKIGFLKSNRLHYSEIEDRYAGYMKALIQAGDRLDIDEYSQSCEQTVQGGYEATKQLLKRRPDVTALVSPTDYAAIGSLRACLEAGKRIPGDISVIGYDDLSIANNQIIYPLTTVAQPKREIGLQAFDMLKKRMEGSDTENRILEPRLVIRETTAPPL